MSGLGTRALLARYLRPGAIGSVLVGILVGAAVFATAAAPRALAALGTDELRFQLRAASPLLVDVSAQGSVGFSSAPSSDAEAVVAAMDRTMATLPNRLEDPLLAVTGDPQWVAHTLVGDGRGAGADAMRLRLDLALDSRMLERIRIVEGVAPGAWSRDPEPPPDAVPPTEPAEAVTPIEVVVSTRVAETGGLSVGDLIEFEVAPVLVVGLFEAVDPDDPYWVHQSNLLEGFVQSTPGVPPTLRASFYVATGSLLSLQGEFIDGVFEAWIPVDASAIELPDAARIATQVRQLSATYASMPDGGSLRFRSALPDALDRVSQRVTAVASLLALSLSGLVGVLLAVVALGIRSLVARRAPALGLVAARGAGGSLVRGLMALEAALVALPAAVLGFAAAVLLLPGDGGAAGWLVPAALALAPVVLGAALATPAGLRSPRRDLRVRTASRVRRFAELGIVALAVVAVVLLARRGLVPAVRVAGVDPLLSATPLLLALAACVVALRLYPAPLLAVQRLLRRRGSAVAVLGSARAVRDPALGFAAALALVTGVAIVVFSTVFVSTVRHGLEQGARDVVGADLQIRAAVLDEAALDAVLAVPGVTDAVVLSRATGVRLLDSGAESDAIVVLADTATLHRLRPDIPDLSTSGGPARILVSDDWGDRITTSSPRLGDAVVEIAGTIPATGLPGMSMRWVLVDDSAAAGLGIRDADQERMLAGLDGSRDAADAAPDVDAAVTATQPATLRGLVVVLDTATALRAARTPAIAGVESALVLAAVASLLLTVLTVVLASIAAAAARNRLLGVVRILGMSTRGLRGLLAWELGPLAITAVVVGTGLGFGGAAIVAAVLDLRPFVGGFEQPAPVVDPLAVGAALAGFVVTVVVAGVVAVAVGRRVAPAGAVKMGDP